MHAPEPVSVNHRSHAAEKKIKSQSASKGIPKQVAASPDMGSQSMLFGAGVALGGVAGALLTYIGAMQRHQGQGA